MLPPVAGSDGAERGWSGLAAGWACADGPSVTLAATKPSDTKNKAKKVDRTSLSMIALPQGRPGRDSGEVSSPLVRIVAFPKRRRAYWQAGARPAFRIGKNGS